MSQHRDSLEPAKSVDLPSSEELGLIPFDFAKVGTSCGKADVLQMSAASCIALSLAEVSTCFVFLLFFLIVEVRQQHREPLAFFQKSPEASLEELALQ